MLQHEERTKDLFMKPSTFLEMVVLELFASYEWKHNNIFLSLILLFDSLDNPVIEAGKM